MAFSKLELQLLRAAVQGNGTQSSVAFVRDVLKDIEGGKTAWTADEVFDALAISIVKGQVQRAIEQAQYGDSDFSVMTDADIAEYTPAVEADAADKADSDADPKAESDWPT